MKSKLIISIMVLALALTGVLGATAAYFSDTGTSNGNTFTAGSLDLKVNGTDENVRLFNLSDVHPEYFVVPENQPTSRYAITNTGSINGYLNIRHIVVTNEERLCIDPEVDAGDDALSPKGELGDFLNLRLFVDLNGNGYYDIGDNMFFNGRINTLDPDGILLNLVIPPNTTANIISVVTDWWQGQSGNDNLAQTDSVTIDLTFTLDQKLQTVL